MVGVCNGVNCIVSIAMSVKAFLDGTCIFPQSHFSEIVFSTSIKVLRKCIFYPIGNILFMWHIELLLVIVVVLLSLCCK